MVSCSFHTESTGEAVARSAESHRRCVRRDTEHGGDFCVAEALPEAESEDLLICASEFRQRVEDVVVCTTTNHERLSIGFGCGLQRSEFAVEPGSPSRGPMSVPNDVAGGAVQPESSLVAVGDIIDASPHHQEHLRYCVVDLTQGKPAKAVAADRHELFVVDPSELPIGPWGSCHCLSTSLSPLHVRMRGRSHSCDQKGQSGHGGVSPSGLNGTWGSSLVGGEAPAPSPTRMFQEMSHDPLQTIVSPAAYSD